MLYFFEDARYILTENPLRANAIRTDGERFRFQEPENAVLSYRSGVVPKPWVAQIRNLIGCADNDRVNVEKYLIRLMLHPLFRRLLIMVIRVRPILFEALRPGKLLPIPSKQWRAVSTVAVIRRTLVLGGQCCICS